MTGASPSAAFSAVSICSNIDAVSWKRDGSTTVEVRPVLANSFIISVHWVNRKSSLASRVLTPDSLMTSSDDAMPSAMALRWAAMPLPDSSIA